ncbi:MAG: bifunctional adenosylcobinamide kinase/adenosylcobinamide-phosphate guanylyltransferase [Clostridia bacterium]|nr:bifunctional adenosylcobinamide kinase/adenosylcobinamide-phosphate guanylyltransferase [Clostridia bacterium]
MIFIIGGRFAGKEKFAKNTLLIDSAAGYDADYETLRTAEAVRDFHLRVRAAINSGCDIKTEIDSLLRDNPNVIIISDELGCGVVPIDKTDREYRELSGRINCYLSERADKVFRVVCGIGVRIK